MIKIVQEGLYNGSDPPRRKMGEKKGETRGRTL